MQEDNPITDIKKYLPSHLNCSICQYPYDSDEHLPMLICFFQHCICLYCLQKIFQYAPSQDEVICPFCKQPVIQDCVDKFRLVQELIESSNGLNQYNSQVKNYVDELVVGNRRLREELKREQQFNSSNNKLIQSLYIEIGDRKKIEEVEVSGYFIDRKRVNTVASKASSRRVDQSKNKGKQSIPNNKSKMSKSKKTQKVSQSNQSHLYRYVSECGSTQGRKGEEYRNLKTSFGLEQQEIQEFPLYPRHLAKSLLLPNKDKQTLPFLISNPAKINLKDLTLIYKNESKGRDSGDVRQSLVKIMLRYNFSALKELDLSKSNLIQDHLQSLQTRQSLFPKIQKLNLSKNRFSVVPGVVYKMKTLKTLNLSNNSINKLIIQITELNNLSELDLWNNQLTDVPLILFNLKKLKKVDLSNNKITRLQTPFIQSGRIKFDLFGNPIKKQIKGSHNPQLINNFINSLQKNRF